MSIMLLHWGECRVFENIYARLSLQYFWQCMRKDVAEFVKNCLTCPKAKSSHRYPGGLLQPLPVPNQIWEDIAMDFIVGLPLSIVYTVIYVIINRLSIFGYFIPLKKEFTSTIVAKAFIQNVVKLHGIRKTLVNDRDRVFMMAASLQGYGSFFSYVFFISPTDRWTIRSPKLMFGNLFALFCLRKS